MSRVCPAQADRTSRRGVPVAIVGGGAAGLVRGAVRRTRRAPSRRARARRGAARLDRAVVGPRSPRPARASSARTGIADDAGDASRPTSSARRTASADPALVDARRAQRRPGARMAGRPAWPAVQRRRRLPLSRPLAPAACTALPQPHRRGADGQAAEAAERAGCRSLTEARVDHAVRATTAGASRGVELERPDGAHERIGCDALVLACNGYGGNHELVRTPHPRDGRRALFRPSGQSGRCAALGRGARRAAARHDRAIRATARSRTRTAS